MPTSVRKSTTAQNGQSASFPPRIPWSSAARVDSIDADSAAGTASGSAVRTRKMEMVCGIVGREMTGQWGRASALRRIEGAERRKGRMDAGDRVLEDVTKSGWTDCIYMLRRTPAVGALGGELAVVTMYH